MNYQWNRGKARRNYDKHGIDFAEAVIVLEDEEAITLEGDDPEEERFITIGMDAIGRVLVVVFTLRGENIRLISARKATPRERKQYEGDSI